jgi:hypothetical protein
MTRRDLDALLIDFAARWYRYGGMLETNTSTRLSASPPTNIDDDSGTP